MQNSIDSDKTTLLGRNDFKAWAAGDYKSMSILPPGKKKTLIFVFFYLVAKQPCLLIIPSSPYFKELEVNQKCS